jgi:hypothetical protein
MSIPEAQLETWSHQGQTGQFTSTYESIRNVLYDPNSPYAARGFSVFLQGSYKNDTNVHGDSDVDVVICTDDIYYSDLSKLSEADKAAYDAAFSSGAFSLSDFKNEVVGWLQKKYPGAVTIGNKAVYIEGNNGRRDADIVIAAELRRYFEFPAGGKPRYETGICFFNSTGTRIDNFPKQHSDNCSSKNQSHAPPWFKKTVRTYKNLRNKMTEDRNIQAGLAPSYFIEGLLYNVPVDRFGGTYMQNFDDTLNWLVQADRSKFVCANDLFYLCHPTSAVTWRAESCTAFLNAAVNKRDNW